MGFAETDGASIYYEINGDGPPVLLIAGYTCDHTFWDRMVPTLAGNFRVVTFDNRGVGRTKDDGGPSQSTRWLLMPRHSSGTWGWTGPP